MGSLPHISARGGPIRLPIRGRSFAAVENKGIVLPIQPGGQDERTCGGSTHISDPVAVVRLPVCRSGANGRRRARTIDANRWRMSRISTSFPGVSCSIHARAFRAAASRPAVRASVQRLFARNYHDQGYTTSWTAPVRDLRRLKFLQSNSVLANPFPCVPHELDLRGLSKKTNLFEVGVHFGFTSVDLCCRLSCNLLGYCILYIPLGILISCCSLPAKI